MKLNRFEYAILVGLLLWLAETWYFGWNATAQSDAERALDILSGSIMLYGFFGSLMVTAVKIAAHELLDRRGITVCRREVK